MALINITPCENTIVQYVHSTSLTVRFRTLGHDSEVQQASRRVRPVVPSTHSANHFLCSCHQSGNPPPFCSTTYHSDDPIRSRRLRFFGHIVRSDSDEDHTCALNTGTDDPPKEWRRQMWLHIVEQDLKPSTHGP